MRPLPVLLALALLATSTVAVADWPQFHADPRNSGTAGSTEFAVPQELWWRQQTGGPIEGSPVVSDNRVFVGSTDGKLYAFDAVTGTPLWNYTSGSPITSTPALSGGILYLVNTAGQLVALETSTGQPRLSAGQGTPDPGPSRASPTLHEGRLYVPTEAGNVIAYNLQTLTEDWRFSISTEQYGVPVYTGGNITGWDCLNRYAAKPIRSTPAVFDNKVFFGSDVHALFAVDEFGLGGVDAGKTKGVWREPSLSDCDGNNNVPRFPMMSDVIRASPAVDPHNDLVMVPSYDNTVRAFRISDGLQQWNFTVAQEGKDSRVISTPAVEGGRVYFGSFNGRFYSLETTSASPYVRERWNFTAGDAIWSSPAVANGLVAFGADDETLYVLNANTGEEVWRSRVAGDIRSSPAIAGSVVYAASSDGYLYAFGGEKPPRQDLMIRNITFPTDPVLPLDTNVTVEVEVVNAGNADAPIVGVLLRIDGTEVVNRSIPALRAGTNVTLNHTWLVTEGSHTLEAVVDMAGVSLEFDRANNALMVTTPEAQEPPPPPLPEEPPEDVDPPVDDPPPTDTVPPPTNGDEGKKTPGPGAALLALAVLAAGGILGRRGTGRRPGR